MASVYEVTLSGFYFLQGFINRWNYIGTGTPETATMAFHLNAALGFHPTGGTPASGTLLAAIIAVQSSSMEWSSALCLNPYDPTDFDDAPFVPVVVGIDSGGTAASPVLALGFRTNRVRLDIGRGYKRFGGLTEGIMTTGGGIEATFEADIEEIVARMSETLVVTDGAATLTFAPAVLQKEKYAVPDTDPVRYAYRYWRPLDEEGEAAQLALAASPVTWQAYQDVRSQVSRQYGRGI